jgi:hypothetical protein
MGKTRLRRSAGRQVFGSGIEIPLSKSHGVEIPAAPRGERHSVDTIVVIER